MVITDVNENFDCPGKLYKIVLNKWNSRLYDFAIDNYISPLFNSFPYIHEVYHNQLVKYSFSNLEALSVEYSK